MPDAIAQKVFDEIDLHAQWYIETLKRWSAVNSGSLNPVGLNLMLLEVMKSIAARDGEESLVDLPPMSSIDSHGNQVMTPLGRALRIVRRPDAPRQVFLNIHYDTVFGVDHPFQKVKQLDDETLNGPGVCDAKGGIITMLSAVSAFERAAPAEVLSQLGWEIFLNPDEELGSPGSADFFREVGKRHTIGLLFEPALPDGSIVGARKGSGNFTIVVRGRAAHAGRDFSAGRSATVALARIVAQMDDLNRTIGGGVTINCGKIEGGGAVNIVPDLAIGRFNVRAATTDESIRAVAAIENLVREKQPIDGIKVELFGEFASPPKSIDARSQKLIDMVRQCAKDVGLGDLAVKSSGGASDGNKLAAAGVAVVDTLGPVGGEIHSDREFVKTPTIAQRAKLTAAVLLRLAVGEGGTR